MHTIEQWLSAFLTHAILWGSAMISSIGSTDISMGTGSKYIDDSVAGWVIEKLESLKTSGCSSTQGGITRTCVCVGGGGVSDWIWLTFYSS